MKATLPRTGFPSSTISRLDYVSPKELASLAEIAEMLGVTKRTVQRYAARVDFPQPIDVLAAGRVWRRADIEAWAKANLPLRTGRPPK